MKKVEQIVLGIIFLLSIVFQMHNIKLYNPDAGFDGLDHQAYISWIETNHKLPLPGMGWEYTQNPLYYLIGAIFQTISINPQYLNLLAFMVIGWVIYKFSKSFIATLAFFGLPMMNYLVPQISNEYLSGMWIILSLFLILKILEIKESKQLLRQILLTVFVISLGFYTKYTSLTLMPIMILAIFLNQNFSISQKVKNSLIAALFIFILISPITLRNQTLYGKPFILAEDIQNIWDKNKSRELSFFTRLDWISKADIYNAREYSFLGGLWNTFWHDGHHSATPVVAFHKKAFGLWALGFPLFVMSLLGIIQILKKNKSEGILLISYLIIAINSLVKYSIMAPHSNSFKAFYAIGIVVPYVLGLSAFSKMGKWSYRFSVLILLIQFLIMVSYFWIQPWWHVVK